MPGNVAGVYFQSCLMECFPSGRRRPRLNRAYGPKATRISLSGFRPERRKLYLVLGVLALMTCFQPTTVYDTQQDGPPLHRSGILGCHL